MSDSEIHVTVRSPDSVATATKGRVTLSLCLAVFGAVMGSLQFGYNTGVINAPQLLIKEFMNETSLRRSGEAINPDTQQSLFSLVVAIFAAGGVVGGLLAGTWADHFGRKKGSMLNAIFGVAAGLLMYFSKLAHAYEMIIVGRMLVGFNCGLYTGLTPMYLSEISTPNIRGAVGVLHQLGVVCGLLLSQILGFPELLGQDSYWDILLGLAVVPCLVQLLVMPLCPESPRHLLLTCGKEEAARSVLKRLRGLGDVEAEVEEIKAESVSQQSEAKVSILKLFQKKSLRMPLLISVVMHLSQQFSGINAIFYYSARLFSGAGLSNDVATHATSGVGAVMVAMTLVTIPLMDRVGRRTLHLVGLGGMFVFSILITVTLSLREQVGWFRVLSIVVSLIYVVFFALGPGSIPWFIVSELFSQAPRAAAISIAVLVNWVSNFVVGYCFPYMQTGLGNFSFLPFSALLALFWLFTFFFLPETKNKTFEEIASQWRHRTPEQSSPTKEGGYLVSFQKYGSSQGEKE